MTDRHWRVSVATLNRVIFQNPEDGTWTLALERKATLGKSMGVNQVRVWAQPFGGAVRILKADILRNRIGPFSFDSQRSESEQDFRILIPPAAWGTVKQVCLDYLANDNSQVLESSPQRELVEEFADTLHVQLESSQYDYQPTGFVIQDEPSLTPNPNGDDYFTVRLYRLFEVKILDVALCLKMIAQSRHYSDFALQQLAEVDARDGGRGRANAMLTLPLKQVTDSYRALSAEVGYAPISVADHQLDLTVSAILEAVDVPQFQRLPAQ